MESMKPRNRGKEEAMDVDMGEDAVAAPLSGWLYGTRVTFADADSTQHAKWTVQLMDDTLANHWRGTWFYGRYIQSVQGEPRNVPFEHDKPARKAYRHAVAILAGLQTDAGASAADTIVFATEYAVQFFVESMTYLQNFPAQVSSVPVLLLDVAASAETLRANSGQGAVIQTSAAQLAALARTMVWSFLNLYVTDELPSALPAWESLPHGPVLGVSGWKALYENVPAAPSVCHHYPDFARCIEGYASMQYKVWADQPYLSRLLLCLGQGEPSGDMPLQALPRIAHAAPSQALRLPDAPEEKVAAVAMDVDVKEAVVLSKAYTVSQLYEDCFALRDSNWEDMPVESFPATPAGYEMSKWMLQCMLQDYYTQTTDLLVRERVHRTAMYLAHLIAATPCTSTLYTNVMRALAKHAVVQPGDVAKWAPVLKRKSGTAFADRALQAIDALRLTAPEGSTLTRLQKTLAHQHNADLGYPVVSSLRAVYAPFVADSRAPTDADRVKSAQVSGNITACIGYLAAGFRALYAADASLPNYMTARLYDLPPLSQYRMIHALCRMHTMEVPGTAAKKSNLAYQLRAPVFPPAPSVYRPVAYRPADDGQEEEKKNGSDLLAVDGEPVRLQHDPEAVLSSHAMAHAIHALTQSCPTASSRMVHRLYLATILRALASNQSSASIYGRMELLLAGARHLVSRVFPRRDDAGHWVAAPVAVETLRERMQELARAQGFAFWHQLHEDADLCEAAVLRGSLIVLHGAISEACAAAGIAAEPANASCLAALKELLAEIDVQLGERDTGTMVHSRIVELVAAVESVGQASGMDAETVDMLAFALVRGARHPDAADAARQLHELLTKQSVLVPAEPEKGRKSRWVHDPAKERQVADGVKTIKDQYRRLQEVAQGGLTPDQRQHIQTMEREWKEGSLLIADWRWSVWEAFAAYHAMWSKDAVRVSETNRPAYLNVLSKRCHMCCRKADIPMEHMHMCVNQVHPELIRCIVPLCDCKKLEYDEKKGQYTCVHQRGHEECFRLVRPDQVVHGVDVVLGMYDRQMRPVEFAPDHVLPTAFPETVVYVKLPVILSAEYLQQHLEEVHHIKADTARSVWAPLKPMEQPVVILEPNYVCPEVRDAHNDPRRVVACPRPFVDDMVAMPRLHAYRFPYDEQVQELRDKLGMDVYRLFYVVRERLANRNVKKASTPVQSLKGDKEKAAPEASSSSSAAKVDLPPPKEKAKPKKKAADETESEEDPTNKGKKAAPAAKKKGATDTSSTASSSKKKKKATDETESEEDTTKKGKKASVAVAAAAAATKKKDTADTTRGASSSSSKKKKKPKKKATDETESEEEKEPAKKKKKKTSKKATDETESEEEEKKAEPLTTTSKKKKKKKTESNRMMVDTDDAEAVAGAVPRVPVPKKRKLSLTDKDTADSAPKKPAAAPSTSSRPHAASSSIASATAPLGAQPRLPSPPRVISGGKTGKPTNVFPPRPASSAARQVTSIPTYTPVQAPFVFAQTTPPTGGKCPKLLAAVCSPAANRPAPLFDFPAVHGQVTEGAPRRSSTPVPKTPVMLTPPDEQDDDDTEMLESGTLQASQTLSVVSEVPVTPVGSLSAEYSEAENDLLSSQSSAFPTIGHDDDEDAYAMHGASLPTLSSPPSANHIYRPRAPGRAAADGLFYTSLGEFDPMGGFRSEFHPNTPTFD